MTVMTKPAEIEPKAFRRALGNFATGVTIITACAPDGTMVGVTASSFNSLSMDPPLILWSSMKEARSCEIFEASSHFAVNILASDQMEMSNHFARQQMDKFAGVEWEPGIGGAPLFPNCAGRFQCELYDKLDGGDHWIFVGRVVAFDDYGRAPLCFHQGSYAMVFDHPDTFAKSTEGAAADVDRGRMRNHAFFLMLRAVQRYQDRYQPKLEGLGVSLLEARTLLVLHDLKDQSADELQVYLNAPVAEASAALASLEDRGLVANGGVGYNLTDAGQDKATQCWSIAEAHADETFEGFSQDEVDTFNAVLRKLIEQ